MTHEQDGKMGLRCGKRILRIVNKPFGLCHFQGILNGYWRQNGSPKGENRVKSIVWTSQMAQKQLRRKSFVANFF